LQPGSGSAGTGLKSNQWFPSSAKGGMLWKSALEHRARSARTGEYGCCCARSRTGGFRRPAAEVVRRALRHRFWRAAHIQAAMVEEQGRHLHSGTGPQELYLGPRHNFRGSLHLQIFLGSQDQFLGGSKSRGGVGTALRCSSTTSLSVVPAPTYSRGYLNDDSTTHGYRRGRLSDSDATLYILYRESLMKYTGWC
jgi:hypothetical protein